MDYQSLTSIGTYPYLIVDGTVWRCISEHWTRSENYNAQVRWCDTHGKFRACLVQRQAGDEAHARPSLAEPLRRVREELAQAIDDDAQRAFIQAVTADLERDMIEPIDGHVVDDVDPPPTPPMPTRRERLEADQNWRRLTQDEVVELTDLRRRDELESALGERMLSHDEVVELTGLRRRHAYTGLPPRSVLWTQRR
jgi:hypothetical protein